MRCLAIPISLPSQRPEELHMLQSAQPSLRKKATYNGQHSDTHSCCIHFHLMYRFTRLHCSVIGPGGVVGIATGYGQDGPEFDSGEISRTCPDRPWGPTSLLYNEYRVFPGGKERPGRDSDPHPLLVPWSRKSRAIPLLLL